MDGWGKNISYCITAKYKAAELLVLRHGSLLLRSCVQKVFPALTTQRNCLLEPKPSALLNAWPGSA